MYDIILEISHAIVKNGLNLSALGTVLFILLKRRRVKKVISKYVPWLAMEPEDVANYEARQIRIEQYVRAIKEHLGVTECVERIDLSTNTARNLLRFSLKEKLYVRLADVFTAKGSTTYSRRHKQMKTLLQKYTSTKLQALIVATIMNLALLIGYVLDVQDIQSKVAAWTPMANLIVQTILTIAYQWARASVDKAELKANSPEVSLYDAKSLDSVRSDSEDVGHTASN